MGRPDFLCPCAVGGPAKSLAENGGLFPPGGGVLGWVQARAGAVSPGAQGAGRMGSRNGARCCGHRRGPALGLRSPSKPAPPQFAEGDQKLIAGFGCVWRERGRAPAPSSRRRLPSPCRSCLPGCARSPALPPRRLSPGETLPSTLPPWPNPPRLPLSVRAHPSN